MDYAANRNPLFNELSDLEDQIIKFKLNYKKWAKEGSEELNKIICILHLIHMKARNLGILSEWDLEIRSKYGRNRYAKMLTYYLDYNKLDTEDNIVLTKLHSSMTDALESLDRKFHFDDCGNKDHTYKQLLSYIIDNGGVKGLANDFARQRQLREKAEFDARAKDVAEKKKIKEQENNIALQKAAADAGLTVEAYCEKQQQDINSAKAIEFFNEVHKFIGIIASRGREVGRCDKEGVLYIVHNKKKIRLSNADQQKALSVLSGIKLPFELGGIEDV
jgi:hypothetical protein